ncbi:MAG: hypothetical protein R3185_07985, partial [Candidatus Thermoplasmatota archaeon]|nr:hypothetical protein [Candidatus Thermoplasmatota archaeon]
MRNSLGALGVLLILSSGCISTAGPSDAPEDEPVESLATELALENARLVERNAALDHMLGEANATIEEQAATVDRLRERLAAQNSTIEELERAISSLEEEVTTLREELNEARNRSSSKEGTGDEETANRSA